MFVISPGFRTLIERRDGSLLRFMTAHHCIKSYYLVLLARPLMWLGCVALVYVGRTVMMPPCTGGLALFGDQTLFSGTQKSSRRNRHLTESSWCSFSLQGRPGAVWGPDAVLPRSRLPACGRLRRVAAHHGGRAAVHQHARGRASVSHCGACSRPAAAGSLVAAPGPHQTGGFVYNLRQRPITSAGASPILHQLEPGKPSSS